MHGSLYDMIRGKMFVMDLWEGTHVVRVGSTEFTSASGSSRKQGDSSFRPIHDRIEWPSLMIEAGWSESVGRLKIDAAWWLGNSGNHTRIVLLTSFKRQTQNLVIDRYGLDTVQGIGTRTASSGMRTVTRCFQTIHIDISGTGPIVDGAPLTLPFDAIMRRQPTSHSAEKDVSFSAADLVVWADLVAKEIRRIGV
jgi:hypothetical protein